jgi:hypothetical protein
MLSFRHQSDQPPVMKLQITLLSLLLGASTFATAQTSSAPDKSSAKVVVLNKEIPVPATMSYLGPGGGAGLAFGAIAAAVASSGIEKERQEFQSKAGTGKTIDRIVYEETLAQLQSSGKFVLVETPEPGAATLNVAVLNYGFSIPHGFSSKLVPILGIRYELRDSSGNSLWSATDRTRPLGNPVDSVEAKELEANPLTRETSMRAAARALATRMIATY